MASASQRTVHQDYIARIRYSNALPPPPNPPKLLDIPNTGLSSGQYTTPGYASRLARDQPLNIEADAELGMPIDLVGMPGIFDGDESCKPFLPKQYIMRQELTVMSSYTSTDRDTATTCTRSRSFTTVVNIGKAKVRRCANLLLAPNRIHFLTHLKITLRVHNF
jgi:hypothetical protein